MVMKIRIAPKGESANLIRQCSVCGFRELFYGSAKPESDNCPGCKMKKENKKKKPKGKPVPAQGLKWIL
jgi:rubrerythrin